MLIGLLTIIVLVYNSEIVIDGARNGLLIWYSNVLPLLLPFMLISGYIVDSTKKHKHAPSTKNNFKTIFITILLGVFCGYPIGAKCTSDYAKTNSLDNKIATLILPLCNNLSPMFISGYVCINILQRQFPFYKIMLLIYIPYILLFIIEFTIISFITLIFKNHNSYARNNTNIKNKSFFTNQSNLSTNNNKIAESNRILTSIIQITTIGVYIMVCSILISLLDNCNFISNTNKSILSGLTEISSGLDSLKLNVTIEEHKKIALILATTSFGGLSSILQTACVIKNSGLSIVKYTISKAICSIITYYLTLLVI